MSISPFILLPPVFSIDVLEAAWDIIQERAFDHLNYWTLGQQSQAPGEKVTSTDEFVKTHSLPEQSNCPPTRAFAPHQETLQVVAESPIQEKTIPEEQNSLAIEETPMFDPESLIVRV